MLNLSSSTYACDAGLPQHDDKKDRIADYNEVIRDKVNIM